MKKVQKRKVMNYLLYTVIIGLLWGFITPIISRYIPTTDIFDFSWFAFAVLSGIMAIVLYLYFSNFSKKGNL